MSDFPEYSPEGKAGLAVIHADWAHAAIYFEDEGYEPFYERLISRLTSSTKPCLIVCLGGKTEVIKQAKRTDKAPIPEICVLDKDFDDLLDEVIKHPSIIYLRRFAIENYLCDLDALVSVAVEQRAKAGLTNVAAQLSVADREDFIARLRFALLEITRIFALARSARLDMQTTKTPTETIFRDIIAAELPVPTGDVIRHFRSCLLDACQITAGWEWLDCDEALNEGLASALVAKSQPWGELPIEAHIVGRYFLGGLVRYVDARTKSTLCDLESVELFTRLASHIDIGDLAYLRDEILVRVPALH